MLNPSCIFIPSNANDNNHYDNDNYGEYFSEKINKFPEISVTSQLG